MTDLMNGLIMVVAFCVIFALIKAAPKCAAHINPVVMGSVILLEGCK